MCIGSVFTQPPYRVWERGVRNAVHFGTLGHGRRGRYCVGLEIDALACFEKWKIRYDGERVLCNSAIVALMGEKKSQIVFI